MSKREILRREQERESLKMKRRKITYVAVGVLALSLIIFGTILAINKSRQGPAIETSQDTISKAIVSIPKSVYDKVGPGSSELQVTKIGNKPDKDGKVKDENYGADKPEGVRKKAQNAYKAIGSYASQLESKKDLAKVDAIAGATVSYDQFNEAVAKAVEAAKK